MRCEPSSWESLMFNLNLRHVLRLPEVRYRAPRYESARGDGGGGGGDAQLG